MIFTGPAVGKTTLARLMADAFDAQFITISAVLGGVKDIREAVEQAQVARDGLHAQRTIVFVDEVHRFNKSQQDAFLPHVESGLFTFIGATTENPSFEVNSALLSRAGLRAWSRCRRPSSRRSNGHSHDAIRRRRGGRGAGAARSVAGAQAESGAPAAAGQARSHSTRRRERLIGWADGDAAAGSTRSTSPTLRARPAATPSTARSSRMRCREPALLRKGGRGLHDQISAALSVRGSTLMPRCTGSRG